MWKIDLNLEFFIKEPNAVYLYSLIYLCLFQDLYVFLTEDNTVTNLSSTKNLIWKETGIEYGNWYSGENKDSTINFHHKIKASKVYTYIIFIDLAFEILLGSWNVIFKT